VGEVGIQVKVEEEVSRGLEGGRENLEGSSRQRYSL